MIIPKNCVWSIVFKSAVEVFWWAETRVWPINLIISWNISTYVKNNNSGFSDMTMWQNRVQDAEVWMCIILHYRMFPIFCSVFCPALNLFLFFIVFLYVTLDEECFSHDTYITKILQWTHYSAEYILQVHIPPTCTSWQRDDSSNCSWLPASSTDITVNLQAHLAAQRLYFPTFGNMISVPFCSKTFSLRSWYI